MKLLSIVVPCYNSADYLSRCVNSLLVGDEAIEIILVDDGSTDATGRLIDKYGSQYPNNIKTVHQANGGHGQAINSGLNTATGKYFKVIDSDDWLSQIGLKKVMSFLKELDKNKENIDLLITNFIYDKKGSKHKKKMRYKHFLPTQEIFNWSDVSFPFGKYLLMHSLIYRTKLLREDTKLILPKHTFYVDQLYAYEPLPFVEKMCYLDIDLYHYFIGRDDQSVNEKIMIKRIDQELYVNRRMVNFLANLNIDNNSLEDYMRNYVEIVTTVSSVLLLKEGSEKSLKQKNELWNFINKKDFELYRNLKRRFLGRGLRLPGTFGRYTVLACYRIAQKVYGFN